MTFDATVTFGNLIEAATFLAGGLVVFIKLNNSVVGLGVEMKVMQKEIEKIGGVIVTQTDQNRRILHLEEDYRLLRHGRGFVQGPRGVDKEWPEN